MRYFVIMTLAFSLIATDVAPQTHHPVGIQRPEVIERWKRELDKADTALKAGEWKKAKNKTQALLSEMFNRIEGGEGVATFLATATFLRSLSEAGLGNEGAANWDYTAAQTLLPYFSEFNLRQYGDAGKMLEAWRIPPETSESVGTDDSSAAKSDSAQGTSCEDVKKPRKIRAPQPTYPYSKYDACIDGSIVVQIIIDEQGVPTRPRLLTTQDPLLGYAAMEALRDWRFKPARCMGKPISAYYNLTVNFKLPVCHNLFARAKKADDGG